MPDVPLAALPQERDASTGALISLRLLSDVFAVVRNQEVQLIGHARIETV